MFFVFLIGSDGGQSVCHFGFLLLEAEFLEFFDRNNSDIRFVVGKNDDGAKFFGLIKHLTVGFLDISGGGGERHKIVHRCLYNIICKEFCQGEDLG